MELNSSFNILQQQLVYDPGTVSASNNSNSMSSMRLLQPPEVAMNSAEPVDGDEEVDCFIDNDMDLNSLEGAANQSRLEHDKMSNEEMEAFPDVLENTSLIPIYLHVRNSILKFWLTNPKTQLILETVYARLEPPFNNDIHFTTRVFNFLERYCYINFGVFHQTKPYTMQQKYKVVILGAGIAGLIAARQLKYFGFEVVVLEARNRLGGRIFTYRQEKNIVADVGAFIITGIGGNPIRVLQKQINFSFQPVNQKCPLYFQKFVIDKSKDEVLETVFNSLLESTSAISNLNLAEDNRMSLGDALDIMVELHERDARQKHLNHLKDIYDLQNILLKHITDIKGLRESINEMYDKHVEAIQSKTTRNTKQEYAFRQNRHDLFASLERYKGLEKKIAKIEHKIRDLQRYNVPSQYLSSMDRTILDWHFANLEFATGTILKSLSLKYWDQDDEFEFTGPQLFANNGFYQCVYNLVDGEFDVKLNHAVKAVIMTSTGVEVQAVNIEKINANDQQQLCGKNLNKKLEPLSATCFHADAVLCTLPLGVLKSSVAANETEANASVEFSPPLPEYKVKAIKRLGYGNLNKVVMVFEQIFWDKNHMFGHVVPCSSTRGEMFLFCAAYKQPVLIALIAGEVANSIEAVDDETIKSRCLTVLNETFSNVSTLKHFFVTRWKSDPWSQGVYTYVSTESTPDDFDQISQPVLIRSPSETPIPRLFFAGEHTIRKYPATVHGALLSGLREATNIANHFLGISK